MSLAEIDEEIRKLTRRIEAIQKETLPVAMNEAVNAKQPPVMKANYSSLPNLQNIDYPKGFERAPITCDIDPGKAERISALEASVRETLVAKNREENLTLLRKIRRHQSHNPLGQQVEPERIKETRDSLRDRILNQWITKLVN